jgi:citrate lyase subunit beta/citryl-CoA lyase
MDLIRSLLFVPAIRPRFIEKAPSSGADVVCLDLEDSVPLAEKPAARDAAAAAIAVMPRTGYRLWVRVNGLGTGLTEAELYAVVQPGLDGISLPKVEGPQDIARLSAYLDLLESARGLEAGSIRLSPWIETAGALLDARAICAASPRLVGAAIGGEDFTAAMGIERTAEGRELEHVRWQVSLACRAAGILAIDTPEPDFSDVARLEADCDRARAMGYRAKWCIHPSQVATVNERFRPSPAEIDWAERVVVAYDAAEAAGIGAVAMDGAMIDKPIIERARKVLAWDQSLRNRT